MALTQNTTRKRPANRFERAKILGSKLGYCLSEVIYARNLFFVGKPDGSRYTVDLERETCTCPATVQDCSHLLFVHKCLAYAATLERRTVTTTPKRQPRIGARRHKALANLLTLTTTPPDPLRAAVEAAVRALEAAEAAKYQPSFSMCMRLEDEYIDALDYLARKSGHKLHDVRTAVEWRKGGCSDVLAIVAEICAAKAAAERRRAA